MADFSKADVHVNLSDGTAMVRFGPQPTMESLNWPTITVSNVPIPTADNTPESELRSAAISAAKALLASA